MHGLFLDLFKVPSANPKQTDIWLGKHKQVENALRQPSGSSTARDGTQEDGGKL